MEENHPWYGGPQSRLFWETYSDGFQGTRFALLNTDFTVIQILETVLPGKLDMRLFVWNGEILAIYNTFPKYPEMANLQKKYNLGKDRLSEGLYPVNDCCSVVNSAIVDLDPSGKIKLKDVKLLCANVTSDYEKNWTPK